MFKFILFILLNTIVNSYAIDIDIEQGLENEFKDPELQVEKVIEKKGKSQNVPSNVDTVGGEKEVIPKNNTQEPLNVVDGSIDNKMPAKAENTTPTNQKNINEKEEQENSEANKTEGNNLPLDQNAISEKQEITEDAKLPTEESEKEISAEKKSNTADDSAFLELLQGSSLLHEEEELKELDKVIEALKSGVQIKRKDLVISTDEEVDVDKQAKVTNTSGISFYLNSIMFRANNNWVIWINGNKITHNSNDTDLEIIKVREHYIKCRWRTGYSKLVKSLIRFREQGLMPDLTTVIVHDNIATVEFVLKPNQSFKMSNVISINEGR